MEYTLIRSKRKTTALEIRGDRIIVRAPLRMPSAAIERFVAGHTAWITEKLAENRKKAEAADRSGPITAEELRALADRAAEYLPGRAAYYAERIGVTYGRITVRNQRTRWGSCSAKGNLNFNCLLMLTPPEVIDSVVVHELCHRKEMNHSPRFYELVRRTYPEYDKWHRWLKENGTALIGRMEAGRQK